MPEIFRSLFASQNFDRGTLFASFYLPPAALGSSSTSIRLRIYFCFSCFKAYAVSTVLLIFSAMCTMLLCSSIVTPIPEKINCFLVSGSVFCFRIRFFRKAEPSGRFYFCKSQRRFTESLFPVFILVFFLVEFVLAKLVVGFFCLFGRLRLKGETVFLPAVNALDILAVHKNNH